ncbi:MAG: phosphodiester glycosidase family protein [Clostridiaceae bacterium]|nr:phosphodiester glycosidase family protein [Clostridiaceae bacterium]
MESSKVTASKVSTNAESDDWNYKSDNIQITIKEETKGSGSDKITYYVADVKLKNSSNLSSAFAKDTFGRNIVETTSKIAEENGAIFAINGDYYGFRSDGILIRNGSLYRDEAVRAAAALYKDGTMDTFNESDTSGSKLLASGVIDTFSFGPVLVKDGVAVKDFTKVKVDKNIGNGSIQNSNPRTGIGMIEANHYVFIVVDGRSQNYSKGMTLNEFAEVFAELGCKEAYNLDGGGSSTMYFMGRVVNNPLGKQDERSISDILYIKE